MTETRRDARASLLWRTEEVEDAVRSSSGSLPAWASAAYAELRDRVLAPAFPCTFGTVAQRKGETRFAFLTPADPIEEAVTVRAALIEFVDSIRSLEPAAASLRPCAMFLPPLDAGASLDEYFDRGWALLRRLHDSDPAPWPARVPRDPEHPRWSFCFGGVPLFVTFKTPAHVQRRSRRVEGAFLVLFQAREGFDILAGDTAQGRHVREAIRRKLAAYDAVAPPATLDHYGASGNREWRQYFASDDAQPLAARCPFHDPDGNG